MKHKSGNYTTMCGRKILPLLVAAAMLLTVMPLFGITVSANPPNAIAISTPTLELPQDINGANNDGDAPLRMRLVPTPVTADISGAVWESSNETVATIDNSGFVTMLIPGETTITATVGSLTATAELTVLPEENRSVANRNLRSVPYVRRSTTQPAVSERINRQQFLSWPTNFGDTQIALWQTICKVLLICTRTTESLLTFRVGLKSWSVGAAELL